MRVSTRLVIGVIGCVLLPTAVQARWDSKDDNKSESALETMSDTELFNEAFDVCVRRAIIERQGIDVPALVGSLSADASDYLGVIYQIAGRKHDGVAPSWMLELTAAHTVKKCQGAFRTFLASQEPQERRPKKAAPRVVKKAGPLPHGDPLEQLPPWLAPERQ